MNRLHPGTTLAVVLNLAALACFATGFALPAGLLSLVAYFAAIKEVSKYTSWYQFITVFVSAVIIGISLDYPVFIFPFLTLALVFAAAASIMRIMYFCKFSYTGYSWFEPVMFSISVLIFVFAFFMGNYTWKEIAIPVPIIAFAGILTWGVLKDKKTIIDPYKKRLPGTNRQARQRF